MKNLNKPNAIEEFFYHLSLRKDFNQDLFDFRKRANIPEGGFKTEEDHDLWMIETRQNGPAKILHTFIFSSREKYKIPLPYTHLIYDYIFYGQPRIAKMERADVVTILPPKYLFEDESRDIEDYYGMHKEPHVRVLILGNGKKSDVLKYIDDNWEEVESILRDQGWERPKVVRKTSFKKRDLRIKELWQKSMSELEALSDSKSPYKYTLIQRILFNEEFGEVNDGYIRKLAST